MIGNSFNLFYTDYSNIVGHSTFYASFGIVSIMENTYSVNLDYS